MHACRSTLEDPTDGTTAFTHSYRWTVGGTTAGTGATLAAPAGGSAVRCFVAANDGVGTGAESGSATLTIANSPPAIASVSISPLSPAAGSTLTCVPGTTSDPDGTTTFTYTYRWTRNGLAAGTGQTLTGLVGGDTARCFAIASDGIAAGAEVGSGAVTIGNSPPVLTSVSIDPSTATVATTLTCKPGTTTDPDGATAFTYAYRWTVDGLPAATTSTLSGIPGGKVVRCFATPNDGSTSGAEVGSNEVTITSSPPVLASVAISPATPKAGVTLTCVPGATSDPDGTTAFTYTYRWTVNGGAAGTAATLTAPAGGAAVRCFATPNDGSTAGTEVGSATTTIANSAPVLASVAISPATATVSTVLTCVPGATTDADGTTSFTFTYRWTVDGAAAGTASTLTGVAGGKKARCYATPSDGTTAGAEVASADLVVANSPPVLASVSITPATATVATTMTCVPGTTSDPDGTTTFTYTFRWTVDGVLAGAASTLSGVPGGRAVRCFATPNDGTSLGTEVGSGTLTTSNTPPVLASVAISPSQAAAGATLTCTPGATSDADGTTSFTYTYRWTVDATAAGTTATLTAPAAGKVVKCFATPNDGTGSGAEVASSALTISNTAPVLASVSLSPTTATASTTLTCVPGTTTDADGTTSFTYTYRWTINGASAGTTSTLSGFVSGNAVRCFATPSDGTTAGAEVGSTTITVGNSPPTIASVALSPTSATEATTFTCTPGTTTDPDGTTTFSYAYAWLVNGSVITPTTSTLAGTWFNRGDSVSCRATASDGTASGSAVTSNAVVVANSAPVLGSVTLSTTSPTTNTVLAATVTSSDADGDTVTYTYAWFVNGTQVATTATLDGAIYFNAGQSVYVRVTPSDGTTAGAAMSSATATVANTPPSLTAVALTPTTAYETSTLVCTPTASDADGTTITYSYVWIVNGGTVPPTTSTLTGTYFNRGQTVACQVTASDGTATTSALASNVVTIANSVPVVTSVTLSPSTAYETTTLTATPASTDADGDTVSYTYSWTVNGVVIAATTQTLTGASFSKGNAVVARAVPSDGSASGSMVSSSSVTIANSPPTAPVVAMNPSQPSAGVDALVCTLSTASTDADGDSITYAFTWTRNGSTYTGDTDTSTTSTVPASATASGDVFVCTATPSDGTVSGTAGTASRTVLAATYTIGYAAPFTTPGTGSTGSNYNLAQMITVSSPVTLYKLGLRIRLADADSVRMALYTSSGGVPGTLVAYTVLTSFAGVPDGGTLEMDVVGGSVAVPAGTYWVTENASGTFYGGYTTVGAAGNTIAYNSLGTSSAFPTTFGTASTFTGQFLNLYMVVR